MKGILFTEPNFIATIEESKTNTRRICHVQPPDKRIGWHARTITSTTGNSNDVGKLFYGILSKDGFFIEEQYDMLFSPKYKVGEKVYLKEPYKIVNWDSEGNMMRLFLKYSNEEILVETPDKDISDWYNKRIIEELASKSGYCNKMFMPGWFAKYFIEITDVKVERLQDISDEDCLLEGIDAINGKGTWDSNPFVFSYYYKLVNLLNEE